MFSDYKSAQEKWGGVNILIDHWLQQRQKLIVFYCTATSLPGFESDMPTAAKLRKFCQVLIDYVSVGHFGIFEKLLEEGIEFEDEKGLTLAKNLYPLIRETTETALDFNDKYDTDEHCEMYQEDLKKDLSFLGETLEERFEMEDQLIHTLHKVMI